jgi:carbon-monoxide dehydrogenase large subunit
MNGAAGPPWNHARLLPGCYVVPACDISVTGALTTTTPVAAYRGAGRPEATYVIERLMDEAARGLGLDPAEIRRRNFIAPARSRTARPPARSMTRATITWPSTRRSRPPTMPASAASS